MFQDIRFGIRTLLNNPGFTLVAMISLALGIGATSSMFSLADALLLKPLPVAHPSNIVTVHTATPSSPWGGVSYRDYIDLRDHNKSFSGLVGYELSPFAFSNQPGAQAQLKYGFLVTGNFFQTLGVQPELGRAFRADEDRVPGRDAVVVLSHSLWEQQFAADPSVIGHVVRMNGIDFTVIGVAPERFTGMDQYMRPALYVPVMMGPRLSGAADNSYLEHRDWRSVSVKGRLQPGVGIAQAQAELVAIAKRLERAYPDTNHGTSLSVQTELQARVQMSPPDAQMVAMLLVLGALVLMVACANVANLLLSRARARGREVAIRLAIGAGRFRLVRQLLTESLLMAAGGCLLGVVVAYGGVRLFQQIRFPTDLPIMISVALDTRVLLFAIAASMLSVILFGLAPALQTTRTDLVPALKATASTGPATHRLWGRNALVTGQIAITLVLLVVASMVFRAFHVYMSSGPGFRTGNLLLMRFDPSLIRYDDARTRQFYKYVRDRAPMVAGVESAALATAVPLSPNQDQGGLIPEGYQLPKGQESVSIYFNTVDDRYFPTMGIDVIRGRGFLATDTTDTPRVAVVNQEMARRYWPKQDAVGKRFRLGDRNGPWVQVVGVTATTKYFWIAEPPMPFVYLPFSQNPHAQVSLIAATRGDAASLTAPLREMVRQYDSSLPIFDVRTMRDFYQQRAIDVPNMLIEIIGAMGVMGLLLAVVGLYGLVAYSVSCRTREIGIRMAIGASQASVLRMVMRQGLLLAGVGIAIGLVISALAGKVMMSAFYTARFDVLSYFLVPLVLIAVTVLASSIPARRASQIEPTRALRFE